MEMKEYLKESARTAAGSIHREIFPTDFQFAHELLAFDMSGAGCDALKRQLFYNQDLFKTVEKHAARVSKTEDRLRVNEDTVSFDTISNETVHAALGIASEAGEMFEEIINAAIENREINRTNAIEEAGDVLWYLAMYLRELDVTFEEVAGRNIAKLKARFPEKFTEEKAANRDLAKEVEALEA